MFYVFLFFLGTVVGSFLNVLIDRLPKEKSLMGRSKCDHCHKRLKFLDLVPVLSFLFLKGRCRYCHKLIPRQYLLIELLTAILFVAAAFFMPQFKSIVMDTSFQNIFKAIMILGIVSSLVAIFFIDLKYQIIPDRIQVSLFIFSLALALINRPDFVYIGRKLIDGIYVMLPILFLWGATRGRGMGFGDVKLAFIMGFFLNRVGGFAAIYLAFVIGAAVGLVLILKKNKKMKSKIAFGPFLAIGTLIVMFFPGQIYFRIFYLLNSWNLR